jgi:hypothetical protein
MHISGLGGEGWGMPASLWLPANGNPFLLPNQRSLQAGLIPGIKFKLGGGKAAIMQSPAIYLTQAGSLGHESPLNTASRINIYKYTPRPTLRPWGPTYICTGCPSTLSRGKNVNQIKFFSTKCFWSKNYRANCHKESNVTYGSQKS